jgi:hypothetical protein
MELKKTHCRFIDGTDGMQCRFLAPYLFTRNVPSKAKIARGDRQTDDGVKPGTSFLHCLPALIFNSKIGTSEAAKYTYERLVEEQAECDKYESQ